MTVDGAGAFDGEALLLVAGYPVNVFDVTGVEAPSAAH